MAERSDYQTGTRSVPVIPYDTFEAANLFLATGRTLREVLPRIGLTEPEWAPLREAYRWFPYSYDDRARRAYFDGLDDAAICRLVLPPRWRLPDGAAPDGAAPDGAPPDLRTTWHIREAVRRKPHIGPFADCGWPLTCVAAHPEATLCCYTHDGAHVYFNGEPLADKQGNLLDVDAGSFKAFGGRWLHDRHCVYGEGEYGAQRKTYWYEVEGADIATFEALNLRYARDRERAYYITGKTIRTKSPAAFEIVPQVSLNYRDHSCDFRRDGSILARDRESVYFYGARLKGARPATFRELGHDYATDDTNVWYLDEKKIIDGADAATFTVHGPGDPPLRLRGSGPCATDRHRPYLRAAPCDPAASVEDWRPFFESRPELDDWWWHRLTREAPRP